MGQNSLDLISVFISILIYYDPNCSTDDSCHFLLQSSTKRSQSSFGISNPAASICCLINSFCLPTAVSAKSISEHFNLCNFPLSSAVHSSTCVSSRFKFKVSINFKIFSGFVISPEYKLYQQSKVSNSNKTVRELNWSCWISLHFCCMMLFVACWIFIAVNRFFFTFSNSAISFSASFFLAAINKSSGKIPPLGDHLCFCCHRVRDKFHQSL